MSVVIVKLRNLNEVKNIANQLHNVYQLLNQQQVTLQCNTVRLFSILFGYEITYGKEQIRDKIMI